jgi:DNA-binding transcriptional LysR family regulator
MDVPASLSSNDPTVLLAAAVEGLGVLQQPDFLVEREIKQRLLVPVLEDRSAERVGQNCGGAARRLESQRLLRRSSRSLNSRIIGFGSVVGLPLKFNQRWWS